MATLAFDEGDLVDFLKRRDSFAGLLHGGFSQEGHPFLARLAANFGARPLIEDQIADVVAQVEQLGNRAASAETSAAAFETSRAFVKRNAAPLRRIEAALDQVGIRILDSLLAVRADDANQSLRQDTVQRRDEIIRLHTHAQKPAQDVEYLSLIHISEPTRLL